MTRLTEALRVAKNPYDYHHRDWVWAMSILYTAVTGLSSWDDSPVKKEADEIPDVDT